MNVTNTTFTNNTATVDSGAIFNQGTLTINGSNFTNNKATGSGCDGGAIENDGTLTINGNSSFINNTAAVGGAILNAGNLNITCTNFINNTATSYGGAIYNYIGTSIIQFNRIIGNSNYDIYCAGGSVNANDNWWGTNFTGTNPTTTGRVTSNVNATTWIVLTLTASPTSIQPGGNSTITADLLHDNTGATVTGIVPYTGLVTFTTTLGTISNVSMSNGKAVTTLNAGADSGTATVSATIDNQIVTTPVDI
jgi:hypothetical protein